MKITTVPVTSFEQNCSLILDKTTQRAAIVDPGGEVEHILQALEELGGQPEKILVTHAHLDHFDAVGELAERLAVPVEGPHRKNRFWTDMLPMQARMLGLPTPHGFPPDRCLKDGDTVTVGTLEFRALHCPGHTPRHIVFYQLREHLALVGDVLFAGSIERTDFPKGDRQTLINAIREKLLPRGDDITLLPGHGPRSTCGEKRPSNPFVAGQWG